MTLKSYHDKILLWIFLGIMVGVVVGLWLGPQAEQLAILGTLFLNALKMLVVPLIFCSLIVGVTHLGDLKNLSREGGRTLLCFMVMTGIAVGIGMVLVNIIEPGKGLMVSGAFLPPDIPDKAFSFLDVISAVIPGNVFQAMVETDVLAVIFVALFMGLAIMATGQKGKFLIPFFDGMNEVIMKMVHIIILFAPIGVSALIAARLGKAGGMAFVTGELARVGIYSLTVVAGLLIHGLIVLPLFLYFLGRRNVWEYGKNVLEALLTAFSTASSNATLPVTMECVEVKNRISNRIAGFVLPLGATINKNGTALYEAVAVIFIAQAYGVHLTLSQQVVIFVTATLATIGAAGIPQAGLVTMVLVLKSVGLPLDGIALLLTVDWLLDRFRTTVNVWGNTVVAAIVERPL